MTPLREELARAILCVDHIEEAWRDKELRKNAFEQADAILPILTREIAAARKAALEEAAKCADDAGDLWWFAYKTIGSGNCADDHMQGKADGAGEIAAAIRKLGET